MLVTHVITRLIVGGAQENTAASVLGMKDFPDVKVELISGPTTGPEGSLESQFAGTDMLKIEPNLVRPVAPLTDWAGYRALTERFRRDRPTIVHTHSGKAGILGRLAAKKAGVPVIIHTIHGPSFGEFQGALANFIFAAAERRAGKVTTHFVVVANAMTRQYLAAGIGRPEQYSRVFSGFPLEPYLNAVNDPQLRAKYGLAPDDFVIGKIARLFELKGHDDLFDIAPELVRQCPRIKFLLVGNGPWRERLEERARAANVAKHFVFTGLIPPTEVPRHVGIMNALVHLSTREGLPRALPQALAAARPVVAYDCDGANEVCLDDETGYLIRPKDYATLSKRLLQLAQEPDRCTRLGQRGQALVKDCFPVERMVSDLHALYLRLAKNI